MKVATMSQILSLSFLYSYSVVLGMTLQFMDNVSTTSEGVFIFGTANFTIFWLIYTAARIYSAKKKRDVSVVALLSVVSVLIYLYILGMLLASEPNDLPLLWIFERFSKVFIGPLLFISLMYPWVKEYAITRL